MPILLYSLLLILLTLYYILYRSSRKKLVQLADKFPGPKPLPLVGNIFHVHSKDRVQAFRNHVNLFKKYGNTVRIWFGPRLLIFTSDPHVAEEVFGDPEIVEKDPFITRIVSSVLGNSLLTFSGEQWKKTRNIITPCFRPPVLREFMEIFNKHSCILSECLEKFADGSPFNIHPYVMSCTLDVIYETSLGVPLNGQLDSESEFVKSMAKSWDLFAERMRRPLFLFDFLYKMSKLCKDLDVSRNGTIELISNEVRGRFGDFEGSGSFRTENGFAEDGNGKKKASLDILVNTNLKKQEILHELYTLINAGFGTTATACAFALSAIGENQEVQEKILEEQKRIFGTDFYRHVTSEDLKDMVYLEQVINETLRLFSPIPIADKFVKKEIPLGNGLTIPAECNFSIFLYQLHRNPDHFPDPDRFDPDRFSAENSIGRHPYAFMPFGAGRRKCVGYVYAIMELKTMLSTVLRRFRITESMGLKAIEDNLENDIVIKPRDGFRIKIAPRIL